MKGERFIIDTLQQFKKISDQCYKINKSVVQNIDFIIHCLFNVFDLVLD